MHGKASLLKILTRPLSPTLHWFCRFWRKSPRRNSNLSTRGPLLLPTMIKMWRSFSFQTVPLMSATRPRRPFVILLTSFYPPRFRFFAPGCKSRATLKTETSRHNDFKAMTTMMDDLCMTLFFKHRWCLEKIHNERPELFIQLYVRMRNQSE